jgi:hypothetical protein
VIGSCQSSVLSPPRVVPDWHENSEVSSQIRGRIDRLPGAIPNSQIEHLLLKKWPHRPASVSSCCPLMFPQTSRTVPLLAC